MSEGSAAQAASSAANPEAGHDRPDLTQIQGNLIGFNKDRQRLVFLQLPDRDRGRAFLAALKPHLATGLDVKRFNDLFHAIHERRGGASDIIQASWTNLALTAGGLALIEAPGLENFPGEFSEGMAARAGAIGDNDDSAPGSWLPPFNQPGSVHAMVILAADDPDRDGRNLERAYQRLRQLADANGVVELGSQDGAVRPDQARGREHFGFKDGISQPAIAGLTRPTKHGSPPIAAGEFIVGYPDESGQISGQPAPQPPPDNPGYNPQAPPPPPAPMPDWAKDGSFVVYRRLRQNVQAFNDFVGGQAGAVGLDPDQLGAKLMGRWKSGAPLELAGGEAPPAETPGVDPGADGTSPLLDNPKINDFNYDADPDGLAVPRAAHIRKTNPRGSQPGGIEETNRHRILRRGIPYGPEFAAGEEPYPGAGAPPDTQDRGLLFLCYQASIERGFEFIQSRWANRNDFPQTGDGRDPIISQDVGANADDPQSGRQFTLPRSGADAVHLAVDRWVITTGGDYFFSPSLAAIDELAGRGAELGAEPAEAPPTDPAPAPAEPTAAPAPDPPA